MACRCVAINRAMVCVLGITNVRLYLLICYVILIFANTYVLAYTNIMYYESQ
jgi:hypothetical protein